MVKCDHSLCLGMIVVGDIFTTKYQLNCTKPKLAQIQQCLHGCLFLKILGSSKVAWCYFNVQCIN